jgi:hypothetical protein
MLVGEEVTILIDVSAVRTRGGPGRGHRKFLPPPLDGIYAQWPA